MARTGPRDRPAPARTRCFDRGSSHTYATIAIVGRWMLCTSRPRHLERTGMTRISGPRQVRIKPLVPRSIPPCSGDKLPMLPQRPRHTQARAASSDWRRRFRRQLTEGRKHRKKEVRCRTRRNRPNLLEVLHRAAASCAEQSAGRGKCCVQGGLPELGGKPPHLPNRDDRGRAPIQKIPFVMQTIY